MFDPTLPQESTELDAAQMRDQLNGLKALIDAGVPGPAGPPGADGEVTTADMTAAIASAVGSALLDTSHNCTGVNLLPIPPNDPPTRADLLAVIDKVNELITALRREP